MSQSLVLKVKGLFTNSNELSEVPEGALAKADNLVIDRDSIAESRRGFDRMTYTLPTGTDRATKYFQYQDKLIAHYSTSKLGYLDQSSGFFPYSGSYSQPSASDKIHSAEANSNFYFTSSNGIMKLDSVTGTPVQAGMPQGLDCAATLSASASGFLSTNAQVAYRVVWGIKDANQNLILGAPSQRATVANATGSVSNVSLQITIPTGITTAHFFQIYRSDQSASSSTTPDDVMQLVYEANPNSSQITAKSVTVTDVTPDSLRGAALYTNDTQQGILQSNNIPPFAKDVALFKNCLFFANTQTNHQVILTLLAVGGSNGVGIGDVINIAGTAYTGASSENIASGQFAVVTTGSAAQNINDTALSIIRCINQSSTNTAVYAYYLSSSSSLPGQLLIQTRTLGGTQFSITASAHGTAYSPALPTSGTSVQSSNQTSLNGLMYSKQQIPEAVPLLNILFPGSASKKILRIIPLRDSLFILKEDGVFRCTGTSPGNFSIDQLDSTAILLAPESAVALSNSVYALTTQGVVQITDNGVAVISRAIENSLTSLIQGALSALQSYSFSISYETDRKFILWTVTNSGDTYATQAFVYNIFTKAWTRWTRSQSHGLVLNGDNKLYLVDPQSNFILQERKNGVFTDYVDEALPISIVSFSGTSIVLTDVSNVSVGDIIYQSASDASVVTAINPATLTVNVTDVVTWSLGSASCLKSIACTLQWVPQVSGNPGFLKHWTEAILLTKQNYFNAASLGFYSDVSGSTELIPFSGVPGGGWGRFAWGMSPWGGVSQSSAFRTYVPLEKQRCNLLTPLFVCQNGWARFQVEGIALWYKPVSQRVSR